MGDEEEVHEIEDSENNAAVPAEDEASGELLPEQEDEDSGEDEAGEEEEFDLDAQVELFRSQIEEEPENCVHHYNLGEALEELGQAEEALAEYRLALEYDVEKEFTAIIRFAIGNHFYQKLISGIHGTVVRSSVGLHSAHKHGASITNVNSDDYAVPIQEFEAAVEALSQLKADDEIVEYVGKYAPQRIADTYYKWGSDLIDKSRQIECYGDEVKDVKESLKYLKRTLEIDPSHSQANLMNKYAKKMIQEGWEIYDEYGFVAKQIPGAG